MLTELCGYLKNWFTIERTFGYYQIVNGMITFADGTELPLQDGQYFRIIGSIFNDGVHCYHVASEENPTSSEAPLKDEVFTGAVWCLAIPKDVIDLSKEIEAWQAKYEGADSAALSPFNSESFGGYSYSKTSGNSASGDAGTSWQSVFGNKLTRYRKI